MKPQTLINFRVLSVCTALLFAHASIWAHWRDELTLTKVMLSLLGLFTLIAFISLWIRPGKS